MEGVSFVVDGTPAPKGSFNRYRNGGGRESSKRYPAWKKAILAKAAFVMDGLDPLEPPYAVRLRFYIHRPQKPAWPLWPGSKSTVGDLDKLERGVLDALAIAGVITDDAHVIAIDSSKRYVVDDQQPGCAMRIRTVTP